ncbi:telomeric repeat-binding factor 1 isoform X2 [Anoplopoma fimbria]|uniref:telomeric repeat-binding factor 1 isoform X2 n=1 Tax=Anoplopoma fimbria TaxID=229290 RepID=UPI0023ED81E5|nr:telomeric repeat-binding factor 1 isoform X2 [Anoplopoma fimbria]
MASEVENKKATAVRDSGSVSFSQVTGVASQWILDFMFVSLCRRFKEGEFDEFNETLSTFQGSVHHEKKIICAFLARVMHGNQLDVQFEEDVHVMPLMSAAKIWSTLKHTVEDESLFENITHLLLVQSVAVCLEKGKRSSASSAIKWFENNHEFPQNLIVKLSTIVTQREIYHPFIISFSYSRLLETIKSYLDAYLEKNPSDYLIKAATKMVQSSQNIEGFGGCEDSSLSEEANKATESRKVNKKKDVCLRTKRKLLSTKIPDVWQSDSCKKPFVSLRRISINKLSEMTSRKSMDTSKIKKPKKTPQKWTPHLDKYLENGVKCHGQGNWSRILMDFDFEGRTGTMLKDRWRVLMKTHRVG